jgi:hypothetical protein
MLVPGTLFLARAVGLRSRAGAPEAAVAPTVIGE